VLRGLPRIQFVQCTPAPEDLLVLTALLPFTPGITACSLSRLCFRWPLLVVVIYSRGLYCRSFRLPRTHIIPAVAPRFILHVNVVAQTLCSGGFRCDCTTDTGINSNCSSGLMLPLAAAFRSFHGNIVCSLLSVIHDPSTGLYLNRSFP
jgi:hypothetical protein